MTDTILIALKIMGQGMLGIFVSILLIMLVITLIGKLSFSSDSDKYRQEVLCKTGSLQS